MAEDSDASNSQTSARRLSEDILKQPQVPALSGFPGLPNGDMQMFPIMYPAVVPGLFSSQNQDQTNRGAGLYAVPALPFIGPVAGLPSNTLIPLTYNIPTRRSPSEGGVVGEVNGQVGQQQQQQQPQLPPAPQRQVERRFQIAFQLDLMLIFKLAAVIFLFNQDGSRQRLVILVFFASLVYLHQTGALTPLIRWLSQGMQRAAAPPQPPRPARLRNENPGAADGQPGAENEIRQEGDGNRGVENENVAEAEGINGGNHWWGIVREIQMIIFGFITSLLPGFHNVD